MAHANTIIVAVLAATTVAAQSADLSGPAYTLLNARTAQNRSQFFVYQDSDSPFNHGFPSGWFGSSAAAIEKLHIDPSCVYNPTALNGCSNVPEAMDQTRGTAFRLTFDPLAPGEFTGLNFEEPQNWGIKRDGSGYDLTGATQLLFEVFSPTAGIQVNFIVNGVARGYMTIPQQWTTIAIDLTSQGAASLTDVHVPFGIVTDYAHTPLGGTVLLDNIRFLPVPAMQRSALGLPLANQVFGINRVRNLLSGRIPIPPDQSNANLATLYESSLTLLALIDHHLPEDRANAQLIADTLVYALQNDNEGNRLPSSESATGLHKGMSAGDIGLQNNQGTLGGQRGQVRLAGFSIPDACQSTGFCLISNGATADSSAMAILALVAAYYEFQNQSYLDAALLIGNWIDFNLRDNTGTGFGGYFLGYADQGSLKTLQTSKATEFNANVFAAFTALADAESFLGNEAAVALWNNRANVAGDFVMQMYDSASGHFLAGTVPRGMGSAPGTYPYGPQKGNDVINTFDFLNANTITVLALASSSRYKDQINWHLPVQWVAGHFQSSVTAGGVAFRGFDLIQPSQRSPDDGPGGIAWEFTAQAVAAMRFVDYLYGTSQFSSQISGYLNEIQRAQTSAPFGDSRGVVASTLQDGDIVAPYGQCLVTPYQCISERVGLASTVWGVSTEQCHNLLARKPGRPGGNPGVICSPKSLEQAH